MGVIDYTRKIVSSHEDYLTEEQRIIETLSILENGFESPVLRGKGYTVLEAANIVNRRIKESNIIKADLSFLKDGNVEANISANFVEAFLNSKKNVRNNILRTIPFGLISISSFSIFSIEIANSANTNHTPIGVFISLFLGFVSVIPAVTFSCSASAATKKNLFEMFKFFSKKESSEMMEILASDPKIANIKFDKLYAQNHNLEELNEITKELENNEENNNTESKITHEEVLSLKEIFEAPKLTEAELYVIKNTGIKQKKK